MKILVYEVKLLLRDRAAWIVIALFAASIVYALSNGTKLADAQRSSASTVAEGSRAWRNEVRTALERMQIDPRQVVQRPEMAVLPPAPLPKLASGQADLMPSYEMISLWRLETPAAGRADLENPSRLLAGRFDLAFVLVWLFPLFLLALAYDLVAGDRESGTLRMALARGVSPWRWVALRALARGGPVFALALIGTWASGFSAGDGASARVGWALLVVLAYGLFWLGLAVLVNGFAKSASSAATALGTAWVAFVLVVPTLLNVAVESLHPMPSRPQMVAAARAASSDAEKRGNEVVSSFYRDHPELAPPGMQADMTQRVLAVQEEVGRAMDPVRAAFDAQLSSQQRIVERWRFVSPAIATYEALTDLAGTGYWRHREFREQVATFKDRYADFYGPKIHKRAALAKADVPNLPWFEFQEDTSGWGERAGVSIAGILALTLIAGVWSSQRLSAKRLSVLVS